MTDTTTSTTTTSSGDQAPPPPATAAEARARREEIVRTQSDKYLAGDTATVSEVRALNRFIADQASESRIEAALAGAVGSREIEQTTDANPLTTGQLASEVANLRKHYSDDIIKDILSGGTVTPEKHQEAVMARDRLLRDQDWIRQYRAGSQDHVRQFKNIVAVLAAPIEGKGR